MATLHEDLLVYTFLIVCFRVLLRMRNCPDKCRGNQNTHFVFKNFFEDCAVYDKTWKNLVESGRPQTTIRHMRLASWIRNSTNIHSQ